MLLQACNKPIQSVHLARIIWLDGLPACLPTYLPVPSFCMTIVFHIAGHVAYSVLLKLLAGKLVTLEGGLKGGGSILSVVVDLEDVLVIIQLFLFLFFNEKKKEALCLFWQIHSTPLQRQNYFPVAQKHICVLSATSFIVTAEPGLSTTCIHTCSRSSPFNHA